VGHEFRGSWEESWLPNMDGSLKYRCECWLLWEDNQHSQVRRG